VKRSPGRALFELLKSVRLAAGLIAWLAVTGMLAALVPQAREAAFYGQAYPPLVGRLIVSSGFSRFFTSVLFLAPAALFFANLAACSLDRFLREIRRPSRRRHGPDILHLGLLVLVAGAVLTFAGRQVGSVQLAKGEGVEMPGGRLLVLDDFAYLAWDDGRPRDWISTVSVRREGKTEVDSYALKVNRPLRLGRISVYQVSHALESVLAVTDPSGAERLLAPGGEASHAGEVLSFMARDHGSGAAVVRLQAGGEVRVLHLAPGDRAGGFLVSGLRDRDISGLQAVVDPGYPVVLAALALVSAGLFLTFARKIGDMKR
jgi:hypothetical protein